SAEHRYPGVVLEPDVLEENVALDMIQWTPALVLIALGRQREELPDAVQSGERLTDLRRDGSDLYDWRGHHAGEDRIHQEITDGHLLGEKGPPSDQDHQDGHNPD